MTSTSSEAVVLRGAIAGAAVSADTSLDLRDGAWTRFGGSRVLGDAATEATLHGLAERSREAARAQGFASGWAEGLRAAQARSTASYDAQAERLAEHGRRVVAQQETAAEALAAAVRRTEETTRTLHAEIAGQAVELALQIAEAVLGRELALSDDPAGDAVRRALVGVPAEVPLVVRLHPEDRDALDPVLLADRPVTLVTDGRVARGDAVVETEDGWVDADLAGALARVREVLGR